MSGVGQSRLPIASKKLILNHLSELMVKIWSEIAAASGEDLVWKQLAGLARCAWHSRAEVLRFGRAPPIRALPSVSRREYPVTGVVEEPVALLGPEFGWCPARRAGLGV